MGGFVVVLVAPVPVVGVLGFAVVGVGVAGIVPVAWSAAGRKQPDAPGRAVAAVAACGYAGFLVEPVVIGALATQIGLQWALSSAVVITGAVAVLAPALGSGGSFGPSCARGPDRTLEDRERHRRGWRA